METVIDLDDRCVELHGRCVELHGAAIELDDFANSKDRHFLPFRLRIGEVVTELGSSLDLHMEASSARKQTGYTIQRTPFSFFWLQVKSKNAFPALF